jgi:hypothetical protein
MMRVLSSPLAGYVRAGKPYPPRSKDFRRRLCDAGKNVRISTGVRSKKGKADQALQQLGEIMSKLKLRNPPPQLTYSC